MFSDDKMPVEEVTVSSDSDPAVTNSLFCAVKMQDESLQLSSGVFGICVTSAHRRVRGFICALVSKALKL